MKADKWERMKVGSMGYKLVVTLGTDWVVTLGASLAVHLVDQ